MLRSPNTLSRSLLRISSDLDIVATVRQPLRAAGLGARLPEPTICAWRAEDSG